VVLDEAIEIVNQKNTSNSMVADLPEQRNLGTIVIRGSSVQLWENIDKV